MAPCKEWMKFAEGDRLNTEYEIGVESFIKYAFEKTGEKHNIKCPCVKCKNSSFGSPHMVKDHLLAYGIIQSYTFWYHHGERVGEDNSESHSKEADESLEYDSEDEMQTILRDFFPGHGGFGENDTQSASSSHDKPCEDPNDDAQKFYRLFGDLHTPLFEGSNSSKLSAIVNLLHIKTLGRWSNESFTMLLQFLKTQLLPKESTLPDCYYDAKKTVKDLGLSYEKIDACVNDCMLFWKDDEHLEYCKICNAARWKQSKHSGETRIKGNGKRIPYKVLRYFPLKPRLQRLFMCSKTASDMRWHSERNVKAGVIQHPADGNSWRTFDEQHVDFGSESRNVRLGLISDGFQPFSNVAIPYSIWPVMLVPYNLPPWMCMKPSSMMLSMLIPGPKGPGDAIDVYLQPLIEELKELWEVGVETYDASKRENFKLRAALFSTINDFPAYGILSGWSTKGKLACPRCHKQTSSLRLKNCYKHVYMRHRRFLPIKHSWRRKKDVFGKKEKENPPQPLSGDEVLEQVKDLEGVCLSKDPTVRTKISHKVRGDNWNKKSIFFELPYWKTLLLRHNLDVMHIEKNICDIILGTIMNIKGKTKDTANSRLDMEALGIMKKLHPIKKGDKIEIPHAPYTLTRTQKELFCRFLKELKVPDGFSSNISRCVNMKECKISGLKSHDCHVLLQSILPLLIRGLLVKDVAEPLIELCQFFSVLCARSVPVEHLNQIKAQIPLTLSKLEAWMPPSCFDIMLHLSIHLPDEVMLGGPVHCHWMYSGERYLHTLKQYVRNKARPEGSIAEGYIVDKCMTLCSRYLVDIETKFNRLERNYDGDDCYKRLSIFSHPGRPLGATKNIDLDVYEREQAHIYALKNCSEVEPFFEEYSQIMANEEVQFSQHDWDVNFIHWFKKKVEKLHEEDNCPYGEEFLSLARGPIQYVTSFSGYVTNGFRFQTLERDKNLRTQNSGVVVLGDTCDGHGALDFYGVLKEVLKLEYLGGNYIVLFRCDWYDVLDLHEDIHVEDFLQRSINNEAISTLLEQNVTETSAQIHEEVSNPVIEKRKRKSNAKPRGGNKCKKVANLRGSEKLGVEFYNNGPVGDNHRDMTRHMGKLVRDRKICPIRVHSWDEIDDNAKEHMWQSVLNKFVGNGFELDRKTTIDHMKRLWQNWRGILKQFAINKKGGLENALKETPRDLTPDDWKWLVKEHFSSDAFKKISSKNSCNRENLTMPHRTGSMPFRQVIWEEMGGKEGKDPPLISEVFKRTRQGKCGTLKEDVAAKYEEIVTVETENPSLSHFEVVEKCFGEQDRGGVVCFGLGLKPKHVRGPLPTRADLTTHLHEKQRENDELRKRIDEMEKARQEESQTNNKKISSLEDKLNIILAAYMQQSSGSDQANASVS